jgi:hypothetical protein
MGHYYIQGYDIRFYDTLLSINRGDISLRIQTEHESGDALNISIHSDYHAVLETAKSRMNIQYYDDPNEPNGAIEINVKTDDVPLWSTLLNGIEKHVIYMIVCILRGCSNAEDYVVRRRGGKTSNFISSKRRTLRKKK